MISQRPVDAQDRKTLGHQEGDIIVGRPNRAGIGTLVERTCRFIRLAHCAGIRSLLAVSDGVPSAFVAVTPCLRRSVAGDHGKEVAEHEQLALAIGGKPPVTRVTNVPGQNN